jgi:hypothetical protein
MALAVLLKRKKKKKKWHKASKNEMRGKCLDRRHKNGMEKLRKKLILDCINEKNDEINEVYFTFLLIYTMRLTLEIRIN